MASKRNNNLLDIKSILHEAAEPKTLHTAASESDASFSAVDPTFFSGITSTVWKAVGTFTEALFSLKPSFLSQNEAFSKVLFGFAFSCAVPADFLRRAGVLAAFPA